MKPTLVAILGALSLFVGATPPAHAEMKGRTRDDSDHRYRLVITVAQQSASVGDRVPTIFCLSPTTEDELEVCLGRHQGHWFFGGDMAVSTFELDSDDDGLCSCERPVVLRADQPFCWPMTVSVPEFGVAEAQIGGFVTILEDVHEIGRPADSRVDVDSNRLPLTIKTQEAKPPKASTRGVRT